MIAPILENDVAKLTLLDLSNYEHLIPIGAQDKLVQYSPSQISTPEELKKKPRSKKVKTMFLTKGDNNPVDDRGLYPKNTAYLDEDNIVGHVYANIPYSGFVTLLLNDYPYVKYTLIGFMLLTSLVSKDQG